MVHTAADQRGLPPGPSQVRLQEVIYVLTAVNLRLRQNEDLLLAYGVSEWRSDLPFLPLR